MSRSAKPIPVPFAQRIRFFLSQQLQGWIFAGTAIAVAYLWFGQTPRVVLTGQVEIQRVNVPAPRDGVLAVTEQAPSKLDRVEKGVTTIARFDVTESLLQMQSLTTERLRLQAELESQRERLQHEQSQLRFEAGQQDRQLEQQVIDRVRVRLSGRQRVDQLTSELASLDQRNRNNTIKSQETNALRASVELEIQALEQQRARTDRLVQLRMSSANRLANLDQELAIRRSSLEAATSLQQSLAIEQTKLDEQLQIAEQQLVEAKSRFISIDKQLNQVKRIGEPARETISLQLPEMQTMLEPFVQALAVQDAKIKVLANQIAVNDLVAPISGRIERIHAPPGTFVRSGDPIATIASDQRRWVIAYLDRRDQIQLSDDTIVQIKVAGRAPFVAETAIDDLGEHYESVPAQLRRNADVQQWGIPMKVQIPDGIDVIAGQIVEVLIQ